jgi:methyl-accepting chemotaxis protein
MQADFYLDKSDSVRLNAVNQNTGMSQRVSIPVMKRGDSEVYENFSIVDNAIAKTGVNGLTATIFQAFNNGLLRITTNIKKENGQRAVGTYIPTDSPVYKKVKSGQTFYGRAKVVGKWYWTIYEPIVESGELIGVLYLGFAEQELLKSIRSSFSKIKIAESGFPFILDSKGTYLVHPHRAGENVFDEKDSAGKYYAREMIEKKHGLVDFYVNSEGEDVKYLTQISYADELGWVIGIGSYEKEFLAPEKRVTGRLLFIQMIGIIVLIAVIIVITGLLAKDLIFMRNSLTDAKDLTKRISLKRSDEVGQLAEYVNNFMENLHKIIVRVKQSTLDFSSINNELASTMEEFSTTFKGQTDEVVEIGGEVTRIREHGESVNQSLSNVSGQTDSAMNKTILGNEKLEKAIEAINNINAQVDELSGTVENLSVSSEEIGNIIGVISDIADQTNLLALNAAIEAARAGDAGRGFAVVADEVRKLAEKTQAATTEISSIVVSLQDETNSVNSTMKSATETVVSGVETISDAKDTFDQIVHSMDEIKAANDDMASCISLQSGSLESIGGKLDNVTVSIQQSFVAVSNVNETVSQIQKDANELMMLTEEFKTEQ